jgi:hypothetical protein
MMEDGRVIYKLTLGLVMSFKNEVQMFTVAFFELSQ